MDGRTDIRTDITLHHTGNFGTTSTNLSEVPPFSNNVCVKQVQAPAGLYHVAEKTEEEQEAHDRA